MVGRREAESRQLNSFGLDEAEQRLPASVYNIFIFMIFKIFIFIFINWTRLKRLLPRSNVVAVLNKESCVFCITNLPQRCLHSFKHNERRYVVVRQPLDTVNIEGYQLLAEN